MTPRYPPLTSWDGDPAIVLEEARRTLGLSLTDPDLPRLGGVVDTAIEQVRAWLDSPVPFDDVLADPEVAATIYSACLLVAVEGYRRKDATFGLAGSFTADGLPVRITNDWLAPVRTLLYPYKQRWGVG